MAMCSSIVGREGDFPSSVSNSNNLITHLYRNNCGLTEETRQACATCWAHDVVIQDRAKDRIIVMPSFGLNRGFAFENSPTPSPRASPAFLQDNEVFHTPCFGDDDFNLESLTTCKSSTNLSAQTTQHSIQPTAYTMSQAQGNMDLSQPSANQSGMSILETLERLAPKFPPQDFEVPDISVTNSDLFSSSINNTRLHSLSIPLVSNASSLSNRPVSVAGSSQGSVSTGFQNHTGASSPTSTGSNMTVSPLRESSEDSDDCLPLAQLAIKRQAQDDTVPEVKGAKKPRTPKKRKKKDPNEPQKPVSAYALFFRDTQAAIKGQNSSASFGEVSKIVASMWEGLDPEHKNVYKKKTEVAKKEYLKQLAAYRASLVSQTALDDQGHNDEVSSSPPRLSPHRMSAANLNPPDVQIGMMSDMSPPHPQVYGVGSPRHQGMMGALSPPHPALHNGSSPPHMKYGNGSPQYAMMGSPSHVMSQPLQQQSMVSYLQSPPHSLSYSSPLHGDLSPVSAEPSSGGILAPGMCIRNGCTNRAIDNVGWDSEYCSNECVVSHCRDVFTAWVAARQATGNSYIIK